MVFKNCASILFTCILFFTVCGLKADKNADVYSNPVKAAKNITLNVKNDTSLFNVYRSFLLTLDTNKMESSTKAAVEFTNLFKGQPANICDRAYFLFDKYDEKLCENIDKNHFKDTSIIYDSLLTGSLKTHYQLSDKLKRYAQKLKDNGFKVYTSEGVTYIGRDLDLVAKWFYKYVSPVMKEYLIQLNKEDKEGFAEDAGLTISPRQFVDRTVWWEKFTVKYPGSIVYNEAEKNWKEYLGTLLYGMENSPVITYSEKSIHNYYKDAYTYLNYSYPSTKTNKIVNPYFKLLLQENADEANRLLKQYRKNQIIL
jgi:hypothetical protein